MDNYIGPREFSDADVIRSARDIDPATLRRPVNLDTEYDPETRQKYIAKTSDGARKVERERPYTPTYDGIDAMDKIAREEVYDGDDFTDRIEHGVTEDSVATVRDLATACYRFMKAVDTCFPGDLVVMKRDGESVYAPWTTIRMKTLLGFCDTVAKMLHSQYTDSRGEVKKTGLYPQRDRAFEKARKLYGTRNPDRLEYQLEYIKQLDEQIITLEEMLDAMSKVYDDAAEKADMVGQLAEFLPPAYKSPKDRRRDAVQQNRMSPMSAVEYDLMCRIEGKDAADAEVERRRNSW